MDILSSDNQKAEYGHSGALQSAFIQRLLLSVVVTLLITVIKLIFETL